MPTRSPLFKTSILLLLFSLSIFLSFTGVIFHEGWPHNHEHVAWAYRTEVYATALRNNDFLPIWTSFESYGLGSPLPLFYHKLYYLFAAPIYLITGSMKGTAILTLSLFALVGMLGIYHSCRMIGLAFWPAVLLTLTFPHLNYVMFDWLIRGALAEFTALCFTVWLMWWCLKLLLQQTFHWSLALILFLIFLSHNVMAYFGLLSIGIAVLIYGCSYPKEWKKLLLFGVLSLLAFVILAGPFIMLNSAVGQYTNLRFLSIFNPVKGFIPWSAMFINWHYFGATERTLQIDTILCIGMLVLTVLLLFQTHVRQRLAQFRSLWKQAVIPRNLALFLALSFWVYGFLQTPFSSFVYEQLPGAFFLGFPWRLLTHLTILSLLVLALLTKYGLHHFPKTAWGILLCLSLGSISTNGIKTLQEEHRWHAAVEVEDVAAMYWMEYSPLWSNIHPKDVGLISRTLRTYAREGVVLADTTANIVKLPTKQYLQQDYNVFSKAPTEVILPQVYSGIEQVWVTANGEWFSLTPYRVRTDPRIRFCYPGGERQVKVLLPTWGRLLRKGAPPFEPLAQKAQCVNPKDTMIARDLSDLLTLKFLQPVPELAKGDSIWLKGKQPEQGVSTLSNDTHIDLPVVPSTDSGKTYSFHWMKNPRKLFSKDVIGVVQTGERWTIDSTIWVYEDQGKTKTMAMRHNWYVPYVPDSPYLDLSNPMIEYVRPAMTKFPQTNFSYGFWFQTDVAIKVDSVDTALYTAPTLEQQQFAISPVAPANGPQSIGCALGNNGVVLLEHGSNLSKAQLVHTQTLVGWHHLMVVYHNDQPTLYLDGKAVAKGSRASGPIACRFLIGYPFKAAQPFSGQLDDLALWGSALSASEVATVYRSGPSTQPKGLQLYYAFDQPVVFYYPDHTNIPEPARIVWRPSAYQLLFFSFGDAVKLPKKQSHHALYIHLKNGGWRKLELEAPDEKN